MTKEIKEQLRRCYEQIEKENWDNYLLYIKSCKTLNVRPFAYSDFVAFMNTQL